MLVPAVPRTARNLIVAALALLALLLTPARDAAAATPEQAAPVISVDGQTLRWKQVSAVTSYVLATKEPGKSTTYKVVSGTSHAPPAVVGKTVTYGLRTNVSGSAWAKEVSITYANPTTAPVLSKDGTTLRWNQVAGLTTYQLVTRVPNRAATYRTVTGTSFTPPAVAGQTVSYGVRTDVAGSSWSNQVAIAYPAAPAPVPAPGATTTGRIRMGIAANSDFATTDMMNKHQAMGSPSVRFDQGRSNDFSTGAKDALIENFARRGIKPLVVFSYGNSFPTTTEVERFCRTYAARYGVGGSFWSGKSYSTSVQPSYIEFGNESSYSYHTALYKNPEQYARLFKVCAEAARKANANVKVLAQADDPSGVKWVSRMYAAVPELNQLVGGWTTHPYGPESRADTILSRTRDQTAAQGSKAPILVTEWGLSTDNGRCLDDNYRWPTCMTYAQARDALLSTMTRWKSKYADRLTDVYYFQTKDQRAPGATNGREHYFGLLTQGGTPKAGLYDAYVNYVKNGI